MATFKESIVGSLAKAWFHRKSRRRLPAHGGKIEIAGLSAPVEVRWDEQGVPYIYAANQRDLFTAQGYVHARDRMWQMELNRRVASGRLSEILGAAALPADRTSRTLGFQRLGKMDLGLISDGMLSAVEAYCVGFNQFLEQAGDSLPIEFSLLKYSPAPLEPVDVMAFSRLMTMQLSHGWGHEVVRAHLIEALGPELAAELDVRQDQGNPAVLPFGNEHQFRMPDGTLREMNGPFLRHFGGSNSWVLSGDLTDTGKPYLCNDPHLNLLAPSVWYQIYLECPGFRVQGVSVPGLPTVMIGHNSKIGWGMTLAFSDIQDVFIEQFEEGGSHRYRYKDAWEEAKVYEEVIHVKDGPDHLEVVLETRNGPVMSEYLPLGLEAHQAYVLKSPALLPSRLTMGWYHLNLAQNWDEFVEALRFIEAPGLNITYADVEGNIGYWVTGKTPVRAQGRGEVPRPAWDGAFDWIGEVPFEEMPHAYNPKRGWLVSANHKIVTEEFPHFMGDVWMNGYRARRIEDLLAKKKIWSRDEFGKIMMDEFCLPGLRFAKIYQSYQGQLSPKAAKSHEILISWDGRLHVNSQAGVIYHVVRRNLIELLLEAAGGEGESFQWLIGKGLSRIFFRVTEFQGKDINILFQVLSDPDSLLLQKAGGKEVLLGKAMENAVQELETLLGKKMDNWKWGNLHQVVFQHALSVRKPLDRVFNVGPIPVGGDTDTVCQSSSQPDEGYQANLANPSYRQILDFSDFNRSLWVKPPGQSGRVGSPHFKDQVVSWMKGDFFPMVWDRKEVESIAQRAMQLLPAR